MLESGSLERGSGGVLQELGVVSRVDRQPQDVAGVAQLGSAKQDLVGLKRMHFGGRVHRTPGREAKDKVNEKRRHTMSASWAYILVQIPHKLVKPVIGSLTRHLPATALRLHVGTHRDHTHMPCQHNASSGHTGHKDHKNSRCWRGSGEPSEGGPAGSSSWSHRLDSTSPQKQCPAPRCLRGKTNNDKQTRTLAEFVDRSTEKPLSWLHVTKWLTLKREGRDQLERSFRLLRTQCPPPSPVERL